MIFLTKLTKNLSLTLACIFISNLALANPGSKEAFLEAWEKEQATHASLESFEKTSENKYNIKFKNIPFEGELILLNYDIEEIQDFDDYLPISKTGYIEFDIPELDDEITQKYYRSYSNWEQTNYLYFSSDSQSWINDKQYTELIQNYDYDYAEEFGLSWLLSDTLIYIFLGIFIYFIINSFKNTGLSKKAIKDQEAAFKQSMAISDESLKLQKYAIKQALEQNKKTNKLLELILLELKSK